MGIGFSSVQCTVIAAQATVRSPMTLLLPVISPEPTIRLEAPGVRPRESVDPRVLLPFVIASNNLGSLRSTTPLANRRSNY